MTRDEIVPPTKEWLDQHRDRVHIDTDASGRFIGAAKKDTTVLAWLLRHGRIDDSHGYYAMVFMDMRDRFRRRTAHAANMLYAAEHFGSDTSDGMFETIYLRVCRRIVGRTEQIITFAVERDCAELERLAADKSIAIQRRLSIECKRVREALDQLIDAIDAVRAEVK